MKDRTYRLIANLLNPFIWNGELTGKENLPCQGPAVFIANHPEKAGPMALNCALPVRVYTWVMAEMYDKDLAPAYLEKDFTVRQLHLKPPVSRWLSISLCKIAVPLFHSAGCVPVYRGDRKQIEETYARSLELLQQRFFIAIFAEDNQLSRDPVTNMYPFMHSFVRLAEMYHATTGKCLEFYPVAIHESKHMKIGHPETYDPLQPVPLERRRLKQAMENCIKTMYMELNEV